MTFKIEKVANMIFITDEYGTVFKAWGEMEFTERKLSNAKKSISKIYSENVTFVNEL